MASRFLPKSALYIFLAIFLVITMLLAALHANENILAAIHTESSFKKNEPRKIAMVMMAVGEQSPMYEASLRSHERYAAFHNYPLFVDRKLVVDIEGEELHWATMYQKLVTLSKYVLRGLETREYDWILWNDCDIFITNPEILLESLIPDKEDDRSLPHIMAAWDQNGFNAGSMLIRVSFWSMNFFSRALQYRVQLGEGVPFQDQGSMLHIRETDTDTAKKFIKVPDQRWFNAYMEGSAEQMWQPHHLLLHLAGPSKSEQWPKAAEIADKELDLLLRRSGREYKDFSDSASNKALHDEVQLWWKSLKS